MRRSGTSLSGAGDCYPRDDENGRRPHELLDPSTEPGIDTPVTTWDENGCFTTYWLQRSRGFDTPSDPRRNTRTGRRSACFNGAGDR
jgi:hypothetical protein